MAQKNKIKNNLDNRIMPTANNLKYDKANNALFYEDKNGEKMEEEAERCPVCGNPTSVLICYMWTVYNDDGIDDFIERLFCSEDCWKKFLKKEIKRLE